jgi:murein DD-endopeptidase MepM/ murein hydrolase activator NlpD
LWTSSVTMAGSRTDGTAEGGTARLPLRAPSRRFLVALPLLLVFLTAAALSFPADALARSRPARGVYHLVKKGETLSGIARAYGIPVETIREANRLPRRDHLEADRAIFIPGAKQILEDTRPRPVKKSAKPPPAGARHATREKEKKRPETARGRESAGKTRPAGVGSKSKETPKAGPARASSPAAADMEKPQKATPAKADGGDRNPAPAGRITIAEGLVFFSEADREQAEKAAAEKRAPPAAKEKETPARMAVLEKGAREPHPVETALAAPERPGREAAASPARSAPAEEKPDKAKRKKLLWPVKGRVLTRFGPQPNGMYMNGVRIAAKEGAPVVAAERGTVIFSAPLKDYGETIILRHDDSYATVYTNLGSRLVNTDDRVRAGARIGLVGHDERAAAGVLHFEVRVKNKALNPLLFLD